jgi:hypothetical protein
MSYQPYPSSGKPVEPERPPAPPSVLNAVKLITFIIALAVVSGVIGVALWLWMARANGQGKNWARILSTVLFGLATLDLFGVLSQPKTALGFIFPVLTWLVGAGAVFLLWRKDSTDFFRPAGRYDPSIDAHVKPPTTLT